MNWLYRIADLTGITLFHGTDLNSAFSIAREGLRGFGGNTKHPDMNSHLNAIYLTPNFDLALRYAEGLYHNFKPVVFEIWLSARHMNKLKTDIMDTWDSAWDQDGSGAMLSDYLDSLRDIERELQKIVGYGLKFPDDFDDWDGLNIYTLVLRYLRTGRQLNRQQIDNLFNKIRTNISPGDYVYYQIRPDGTVKLTPKYWQNVHQVQYNPIDQRVSKTRIPPSAIRFVWVPYDMVPKGIQPMEVGNYRPELLPDESRQQFEDEETEQNLCKDQIENLQSAETPQDIQSVIDAFVDWNTNGECVIRVKQMAERMLTNPEKDWSSELDSLYSEYAYFDQDDWGETKHGEEIRLAKLPLSSFLLVKK